MPVNVANLVEKPVDNESVMEKLNKLPADEKAAIIDQIVKERYPKDPEFGYKALQYDWQLWGRPDQLFPIQNDNWTTLSIISGRGYGKTRTGAEWIRYVAENKLADRIALVGRTAGDVNATMIHGHALSLDTEIPTPNGWKTMEGIHSGDFVFDENGNSVEVIWESVIHNNRPCYKVIFSDKSEVVCDENHLWKTEPFLIRHYNSYKNKTKNWKTVFTTKEIKDTLKFRHDIYNHVVKNISNPVVYNNSSDSHDLPIHPYVIGYWLGDGNSKDGTITTMDADVVDKINYLGYCCYEPEWSKRAKSQGKARTYNVKGILPKVKELNLFKNKHIPEIYLQSSVEARLELLRGLLDSDGSITKDGQISFCNTNENLIAGFKELISSLGIKFGERKRIPSKISGKVNGKLPYYELSFYTNLEVFSINRKKARQRYINAKKISYRTIVSVVETKSVPVKCIKVKSESGLFLCSKNFIPTHNSGIMSVCPPYFMPKVRPAYKEIVWPNGVVAQYFPLDVNTEVPTPQGFKLLKELRVGDSVFDATGKPCNVTKVFPEQMSDRCYELTFENQEKVTADWRHLWRISSVKDRGASYRSGKFKSQLRTTEEIFNNLRVPHKNRSDELDNWIKLPDYVDYEKQTLPIHPYVLGAWLGDGTHNASTICTVDSQLVDEIRNCGYEVRRCKESIYYIVQGLVTKIRELGLYKNKHIPDIYKYSSVKQRLDLLKGLFDTDGTVSKIGEITFTNTNKQIIDSIREIIASLGGWSTVFLQKETGRTGYKQELPIWRLHVRGLTNLFRLSRKLEKCQKRKVGKEITITNAVEIPPVYVKCIEVDSEDHLFLITRNYIPTRNSAENPDALRGPQFSISWVDEYCFIRNTKILTPDGEKNIQDIKEGDIVRTHNGDRRVLSAAMTGKNITFSVFFSNGSSLTGTFSHPISSRKHGWIKLGMLRKGDLVNTFHGTAYVTRIERNPFHWKTWNLEVEKTNTYYANGILVHNCALRYLDETMDMLKMTMRLGKNPKLLITTTPRPIKSFIDLLEHKRTYTITGSTFENKSNLAASFIEDIEDQYGNTTLGRQELYGEIISDDKEAVWSRELIEQSRLRHDDLLPPMRYIYLAIDPAVTSTKNSAETGITIAGCGIDGKYYVLKSDGYKLSPQGWAKEVVRLVKQMNIDKVIGEVNNGGDMIETILRGEMPDIPYYSVRASHGKVPRALPILALYERGLVKHWGYFDKLEQQMCNLNLHDMKGKLVDVVDSLVWCLHALSEKNNAAKQKNFQVMVGGYRQNLISYRPR